MAEFEHESKINDPWKLIGRCLVSFISVCFTHFALFLISYCFLSSSFLALLFLAVMMLVAMAGIGRCCKSFLGLRASAPAFVLMNIFFIWCVYIVVIRRAISSIVDIVFNTAVIMLVIGLYSILSSDPGFVKSEPANLDKPVGSYFTNLEAQLEELEPRTYGMHRQFSSESLVSLDSALRVRYCKHCKAHVKGFDHHCPAFGNCQHSIMELKLVVF